MKRWIAICLIALSLAFVAQVHRATEPSSVAYACSWTPEHTNSGQATFWSPALGIYDTLHASITTYDGVFLTGYQCNTYKEYVSYQSVDHGTPGTFYSAVRVWVCGSYRGLWSNYSAAVWSDSFNYTALCGRQADNYSSYFQIAANGARVSVSVNQG